MLSVFEFEGKEVRFVGTWENPEWVAKDVCLCLGLSNITEALNGLEEYDCGEFIINDATNRKQAWHRKSDRTG
jgi:prophage antirepressor-like protein